MNCSFVIVILAAYMGMLCQAKPSEITLKMPNGCAGQDFCQEVHPDYPMEIIENLLKDKIPVGGGTTQITDRDGDSEGDLGESVCKASRSFDKIYEIIDDSGNLRFVVQADELFTQVVRIEQCVNPGRMRTSNIFSHDDLDKFNVACETKRIEYKFLVLTENGTGLEMVKVKNGLPVCCSCRVYDSD